jgi:hypothetical protein
MLVNIMIDVLEFESVTRESFEFDVAALKNTETRSSTVRYGYGKDT